MLRKLRTSIPAAFGLLVLILDTRTALTGAADGLNLCLRTVIPSLFPFFVLSILLTSALTGESIPLFRPLGRLCNLPKGAESILLVGMLGGYPAGAQSAAQAYTSGALSKRAAQRMLAFCNLVGPAFLFGIVATKFENPSTAWMLWGIQLLSAILVAMLLPVGVRESAVLTATAPLTLPEALNRSLRIMATVCGWIILFRILIAFLGRWLLWLLPIPAQVTILGILELSNGCCALDQISSDGLRFLIATGMLSFGGLCVTLQTASVAQGLNLKTYISGKLLQVLISLFLAILFLANAIPLLIAFPVILGLIVKILHKKQKRYSISKLVGV